MADDKEKKPSEDAKEVEETEASVDEPGEGAQDADAADDESEAEGSAEGASDDDDEDEEEVAAKPEPVVPSKSKKKSAKKAKDKPADKALKAKPAAAADEAKAGDKADERVWWPVDKDHRSSIKLLTGEDASQDIDLSEDPDLRPPSAMNMVLLILILAVAGVGIWQFYTLSSAEALAAKRQEREEIERKHSEEQLAKQKKYGIIRIETSPGQADVFRDGVKMVTTKPDTGEEIVVQTPTNMLNMEVAIEYKFKVEKPGYEPFEFGVAEHLWTKDSASGEYKFIKMVELTPNICEYWFLYDAKRRREVKFEDGKKEGEPTGKDTCQTYYDEAVTAGTSVTECVCKLPPEGLNPEDPDAVKKP